MAKLLAGLLGLHASGAHDPIRARFAWQALLGPLPPHVHWNGLLRDRRPCFQHCSSRVSTTTAWATHISSFGNNVTLVTFVSVLIQVWWGGLGLGGLAESLMIVFLLFWM